ncbi:hypothetical protein [Halorhabdus amylolytica]|uniref:hypothetical protein n=1 Tax=Halorhabdus amylolytica TaxID=2559573 RepID=UPI0010AA0411|nr:hypothetical protein [Halorhabdus amylolytica]
MTEVECERCGTVFDTARDGVAPGQDTTRCPSCGKQHPVHESNQDAPDGATSDAGPGATASLNVGDDGRLVVEVHAHIHVHE